jgi:hypothetical protein
MKMIQENEVRFVDLRFTDIRGKEHHVGLPVSAFEEEHFEHGHPFDGSSLAGWKGIQASDMILMPDAATAYIDPFFDETTLVITCDVIEPSDGKGYDRDPRSIAKRAEAYLKSTGIGDTAFFGPEPEFFIFDSVEWSVDMSGVYSKIISEEAAWSTADKFEGGNTGHRPRVKGGYFPVPAGRQPQRRARRHGARARGLRRAGRGAPPRGGQRRPVRDRHQVQHADPARRLDAGAQVHRAQRRPPVRQDRHLHAQAHRRRQRLRHARAPVDLEGRQEPVRGQRLRRPVRDRAVLHRRHHQARPRAQRHHQPGHQLVQAPGAALRGPDQARLLGAQPLGLDPHPLRRQPEGPPHRVALPGSPWPTPTCASPR